MATALVCEICGGKLIGKPGGIFECDSCGIEYSTEWAKAKIQEIKGTVKVEGTVEVQGTVKVEGPIKVEGAANSKSLLRRGQMALEDKKLDEAKDYFNQVLDIDPECGMAYFGLALTEERGNIRALANSCVRKEPKNIMRAREFADDETRAELEKLDEFKELYEQKLKEEKEAHERQLEERRIAYAAACQRVKAAQGLVEAGHGHTVGLKSDGTVVAVGTDANGECRVLRWRDIVAVSAGSFYTVGLKSDGTVVATGDNKCGQCNVKAWSDIMAVCAGREHTVGLKSDGTVVAVGDNAHGQCEVSGWTDIVAVSAGSSYTVGLKSDGTVVAVGSDVCHGVKFWKDIVAVSAGRKHTVGLKSDGTVVACGYNDADQCEVSGWTDIVAISAGGSHTIGLRANGHVVAAGADWAGQCGVSGWRVNETYWKDIVAISAGFDHTVGVKADGTVVSTRFNSICYNDKSVVSGWKLFKSLDTVEQEMAALKEKAFHCHDKRIIELNEAKARIEQELSGLKGAFSGVRRKMLETNLNVVNKELKDLEG